MGTLSLLIARFCSRGELVAETAHCHLGLLRPNCYVGNAPKDLARYQSGLSADTSDQVGVCPALVKVKASGLLFIWQNLPGEKFGGMLRPFILP